LASISSFLEDFHALLSRNGLRQKKVFFLVVLLIANSLVRVLFSYLARDFWSALGDQDVEGFYDNMQQFLLALILLAPINVIYKFQQQRLGIH
jgi:putative ATP-binding cassette transporter